MPEPVAIQTNLEPTNKLQAGTNAAGGVAAVLASVMAAYGADAIREIIGTHLGPNTTNLLIMAITGVAAYFATTGFGRAAAYNVLDKPNVPLVPSASPVLTPTPAL